MIEKRGSGTWLIRIYIGRGEDGKKKYYNETFYAPLKSLAQDRERELSKQLKITQAGPKSTVMTIGEQIDDWLLDSKDSLSASSYRTYEYYAKTLKPVVGGMMLWSLTGNELNKILRDRFINYSVRSRHNIYSFLRTVLRSAIDSGRAPQSILLGFKMPRVPRKERNTLSRQELFHLSECAADYRYGLAIRLLALTGARAGEILGLTWQLVDFNNNSITINKGINLQTRVLNDRPKTENSRRTIILDDVTMGLLKQHYQKIKAERKDKKIVPLRRDDSLVFVTQNGKPVAYKTIQKTFESALKKAGLPHMRVHDLRHSVITVLLTEGNSIMSVAALAGQNVNTTTGKYAHTLKRASALSVETHN